jgi:hypothetical protein
MQALLLFPFQLARPTNFAGIIPLFIYDHQLRSYPVLQLLLAFISIFSLVFSFRFFC